jgi:hypothetical protein
VASVTLTGLVVVVWRDVVTAAQSGLVLSCVLVVSSPILFRNVLFGELFCLLKFWVLWLDR